MLEPSFGKGDFLRVIVARLLDAYRRHAPGVDESRLVADLGNAIRAVEIHIRSVQATRTDLLALMRAHDVSEKTA